MVRFEQLFKRNLFAISLSSTYRDGFEVIVALGSPIVLESWSLAVRARFLAGLEFAPVLATIQQAPFRSMARAFQCGLRQLEGRLRSPLQSLRH